MERVGEEWLKFFSSVPKVEEMLFPDRLITLIVSMCSYICLGIRYPGKFSQCKETYWFSII